MKKGQLDSLAVAEMDRLRANMASDNKKANGCCVRRKDSNIDPNIGPHQFLWISVISVEIQSKIKYQNLGKLFSKTEWNLR
jgi:hypothetical protein